MTIKVRVLSLDIATTTGWAFITDKACPNMEYGLIKTDSKLDEAERLADFRIKLKDLLLSINPSHIVIEDVYSGINISTMKLLSKFAGVAVECCYSTLNIKPYIIHTNTVKSYFKVKSKYELFDFAVDVCNLKDMNFKKDNDVVDAICQLLCYIDQILKLKKFRVTKEYGYLYEV